MSLNGHKSNGWPPLPVHPGDGSPDDSLKLIGLIAGVHPKFLEVATAGCGPDCECPCRACSIDEPFVVHECWHKLAA